MRLKTVVNQIFHFWLHLCYKSSKLKTTLYNATSFNIYEITIVALILLLSFMK